MFPSIRSEAKHYDLPREALRDFFMTAAPHAARWRAAPIRTVIHGATRSMAAIVAPMMQRIHWDLHLVDDDCMRQK
jgi:hypothetical protein